MVWLQGILWPVSMTSSAVTGDLQAMQDILAVKVP
jgi:hypothetical protein